ncbi:PKD domain-containing protein [Halocola ammonii]
MPSTIEPLKTRFYLLLRNVRHLKISERFLTLAFLFFLLTSIQAQTSSQQFSVELEFRTDCLPGQTDWQLTNAEGEVIGEESYSGYAFPLGSGPHEYSFDLSEGCYTFTVYDSGGNGMNSGGSLFCWNNGGFTISMEDEILAELENPAFGSSVSYTFCLEAGCIDPMASNYNEDALADDGSCEYEAPSADFTYSIVQSGCGDAQVNFEVSTDIPADFSWSIPGGSPASGTGSSFSSSLPEGESFEVTLEASNGWGSNESSQALEIPEGQPGTELEFVFEPDCWGDEIGWTLYGPEGGVIAEVHPGDYQNEFPENSISHRTALCASNGCYTLEISDGYGDGFAGEMYQDCNEDGVFYIEDESGEQFYLFQGNPQFGSEITVEMCLTTHFTWRGTVNSNWNNPLNWEENQVPGPNHNLIFDQVNFAPQITQNIAAKNIIIRPGSVMNFDEFTVNVNGNIRIDGDISAQQGTLRLNGNGKHKLISNGQPVIRNLSVDVDTLEVLTPVTITGRLNIENGVMDMKENLITLVSDEENTGSIGPLVGNAEIITNRIRVQRYIPAGPAGWRMLCTPVVDATFEQWNDDFVTTGFEGADYPTYGGADNPWSNIRYYDETMIGFGTNVNYGFESIGSVTDTIDNDRGYFVYMVPAPTMVEVEGNFHRGDLSLPLTYTESETDEFNDGWNLVANPYPSAISWDAASGWVRDGIFDAIYLYDPYSGQYSTYVAGISNGSATAEIASGQAFWVKTNGSADPQLVINEMAKVSGHGVFMRSQPMDTETVIHIDLISETTTDRAVIGFNENATKNFDGDLDAFKFFPQNANLPSVCTIAPDSVREQMSINLFPTPTEGGFIDIMVKEGAETSFTLRNSLVDAYDNNLCLTLEDRESGNFYTFNQGDELAFEKTEFPLEERFALHFSAPLQVGVENETCPELNDGTAVSQGYGEGPWTYQWRDLHGELLAEIEESNEPGTIENLAPGHYTLTVLNESELCPVASTTFQVQAASEPTWETEALAAECNQEFGSSILVDVEELYEWEFELQNGEGELLNTFTEISEDFVIDSLSSGVHRLVATHNCSDNFTSQTIALRDEDAPNASFSNSADTLSYSQGASVSFFNQSANYETLRWDFGDGNLDSLTQNPVHVYAGPGVYSVSLVVSDGQCSDEFNKTITVSDEVLSDQSLDSGQQEIMMNYFAGTIEIDVAQSINNRVEVEVLNSAGQLVISKKLNGIDNNATIAADGLPAGVFWVNVRSGGKLLHSQRIVETNQ